MRARASSASSALGDISRYFSEQADRFGGASVGLGAIGEIESRRHGLVGQYCFELDQRIAQTRSVAGVGIAVRAGWHWFVRQKRLSRRL